MKHQSYSFHERLLILLIPKVYRDEAATLIKEDTKSNRLQVISEYLIGGISYRTRKLGFQLKSAPIRMMKLSLAITTSLLTFSKQVE